MRTLPSRPVLLAGALCSFLVTAAAAAQTVADPARYLISTGRRNPDLDLFESQSYTAPGDYANPIGTATVSVRTSPFTLLAAYATTDRNNTVTTANARMTYSFRILGAPGTRVDATFAAEMFASVLGTVRDEVTGARSAFDLFASDPTGRFYDAQGVATTSGPRHIIDIGGGSDSFGTPVSFTVDANAQYEVQLRAVAQTATRGVMVNAYIDPVITIDPAFQRAYSLVLSPGVSNLGPTATVPEPGTLALVGTGVVGVIGVMRRRRVPA